jgi:hypothetical protein
MDDTSDTGGHAPLDETTLTKAGAGALAWLREPGLGIRAAAARVGCSKAAIPKAARRLAEAHPELLPLLEEKTQAKPLRLPAVPKPKGAAKTSRPTPKAKVATTPLERPDQPPDQADDVLTSVPEGDEYETRLRHTMRWADAAAGYAIVSRGQPGDAIRAKRLALECRDALERREALAADERLEADTENPEEAALIAGYYTARRQRKRSEIEGSYGASVTAAKAEREALKMLLDWREARRRELREGTSNTEVAGELAAVVADMPPALRDQVLSEIAARVAATGHG